MCSLSVSTLFPEPGAHWARRSLCRLAWLTSELWRIVFTLLCWGRKHVQPCTDVCVGAAEANSALHAFTLLPTKPPPQLCVLLFCCCSSLLVSGLWAIYFSEIENASGICGLSLQRGHANLLCSVVFQSQHMWYWSEHWLFWGVVSQCSVQAGLLQGTFPNCWNHRRAPSSSAIKFCNSV